MLVYMRGAETPGYDSYEGRWLVVNTRWLRENTSMCTFALGWDPKYSIHVKPSKTNHQGDKKDEKN